MLISEQETFNRIMKLESQVRRLTDALGAAKQTGVANRGVTRTGPTSVTTTVIGGDGGAVPSPGTGAPVPVGTGFRYVVDGAELPEAQTFKDVVDPLDIGDVNLLGLVGAIITSESAKQSLEDLDLSLAALNCSGFGAWTSGADASTWTISSNKFQLDRAGYGFIRGKKVAWAAGQQTAALTANTMHWILINSSGVLDLVTSVSSTTYLDNIVLFEVLYDGTIYQVAKEFHAVDFQSQISAYLHNNAGTVVRGNGGVIDRVATGTGAAAGDREIKIVGGTYLDDHGLSTVISDSAGAAVTWNVFYRDGSGKWIRYVQQAELPVFFNNAGTPTALDAVNIFGEYVLYVAKDTVESASPQYIAVMGEVSKTLLADIQAVISGGTSIFATNELQSLEMAQLGYAVVKYTATGGQVEEVVVARSTFNQQLVGGGGGGSSDHSLLTHLDYASAGHTGFQPALTPATPLEITDQNNGHTYQIVSYDGIIGLEQTA